MEQFYREIIAWRKPLYMLEDAANDYQISLGAIPVRSDSKSQWA
jgi:hypothetical protein